MNQPNNWPRNLETRGLNNPAPRVQPMNEGLNTPVYGGGNPASAPINREPAPTPARPPANK